MNHDKPTYSLRGDNFLSRPDKDIHFLYNLLLPEVVADVRKVKSFPVGVKENGGYLHLVESGRFEIVRMLDNLCTGTGRGPMVIGLQELFVPSSKHYIRFQKPTRIYAVPVVSACEVIENASAWRSVSGVFAYFIRCSVYRDERMVDPKSYNILCYRLDEYMKHRDWHIKNNTGIIKYIINSSTLSRSLVHKYIKELKKGGYIEVTGGKLERVNYLPKKF